MGESRAEQCNQGNARAATSVGMSMRTLMLAGLSLLAAFADPGSVDHSTVAVPHPGALAPHELHRRSAVGGHERAVVERFGSAALARAREAGEFVAVLRYQGLPMPPYDTDGHPIKPSHPTALLFRDDGRWFAFGADGAHPVLPRWAQALDEQLASPALWAEPADGGEVGCTDAGASYAWLRVAGRPEHSRIGHCGGSPLTEVLVSAALMG